MKIKTNLLATALVCSLGLLPASAFSMCDKGGGSGGGMTIDSFSEVNPSISVSVKEAGINVSFLASTGVVRITIQDNAGLTVSNESVDTSDTRQTYIDTFGLPSGSYTINIADANGKTLHNSEFTVH